MIQFAVFLSTFGYIGYAPVAPGTVGSAAGLVVFFALRRAESWPLEVLAIVLLFVVGSWAGTTAERYFGGVDPGPVVIDEVVGMLITLLFIPVGWVGALLGFFLFRVFDVVKPFPAGRLERLPGGVGVMADDAMAAIYANAALWFFYWLAPGWLG